MADKISIYTLGHSGVILDQNPLEPSLPEDSLRLAQNATHDPTKERGGGIVNRKGLRQFNPQNAGAAILGGIPMPVAGTGGAPAVAPSTGFPGFDDVTGTAAGAGSNADGSIGVGAPGTFIDTGGTPIYTPPGAALFNGGSTIFGGARLLIIGRIDNTAGNEGGSGWYISSKSFADTAISASTPGPPASPYAYPSTTTFPSAWGGPSCIVANVLYYAATHGNQVAGTQSTIRKTNGATDTLVGTIPFSLHAEAGINGSLSDVQRQAIVGLHAGSDSNVYICVKDKFDGQATSGSVGRVFQLNTSSNAITEVTMGGGAGALFSRLPYVSFLFAGRLFVGTYNENADVASEIWATTPDMSGAGVDLTNDSQQVAITCMGTFNGRLWAGSAMHTAGGTVRARLFSRSPTISVGNPAAWVAQESPDLTDSHSGAYFVSMATFNDHLYISYYDPSTCTKIYRVDATNPGNAESSLFTLTLVINDAVTALPFWLFADDGVLYAISRLDGDGSSRTVKWTTDGTTWSSSASKLPTFGNASNPIPLFFAVNQ